MRKALWVLALAVVALVAIPMTSSALAGVEGRYRIHLVNEKVVEGDVKELPDGSYEVKDKRGIVIKIPKGQVKAMVALEDKPPAEEKPVPKSDRVELPQREGGPQRRPIPAATIEAILAGITADIPDTSGETTYADLDAPLDLNEERVREMLRMASLPSDPNEPLSEHKNVLIRPHFVIVFTSAREDALALATRVEAVWRWNTRFLEQMKVKPVRPPYKLEMYFFDTNQEFRAYSLNRGSDVGVGVLGYWSPDVNRSHFFNLWNWPIFDGAKEALKRKDINPETRRRLRNGINAWVEHNNCETIQHEIGHHIHFNTGLFLQTDPSEYRWLPEGTTMMFEVPPPTGGHGGASLGELNDSRLDEFRKTPRFDAAFWREFVLNNNVWFQMGGNAYPLGWALVYYQWRTNREGLSKFYSMVWEHDPGVPLSMTEREKEFTECFGVLNDEWVEKFYKFMDSLQIRPSRIPPDLSQVFRP